MRSMPANNGMNGRKAGTNRPSTTLAPVALKECLAAPRDLRRAAERPSFEDLTPIMTSKPIRDRIADNRTQDRPTDQWPERDRTDGCQCTYCDNDHRSGNDGADCRNGLEHGRQKYFAVSDVRMRLEKCYCGFQILQHLGFPRPMGWVANQCIHWNCRRLLQYRSFTVSQDLKGTR